MERAADGRLPIQEQPRNIRSCSSPQQGDSAEVPPPTSEDRIRDIEWLPEVAATISIEVNRLTQCAVTCRIVGARPSRGELRGLLHNSLQDQTVNINNIHMLGKGYYQIETSSVEEVQRLLTATPLHMFEATAIFSPWVHGFNVHEATLKGEKYFKLYMSLPGLPQGFQYQIKQIANSLGTMLEDRHSTTHRKKTTDGVPGAKVLVSSVTNLPTHIRIPLIGKGSLIQKVEFTGLPNQCLKKSRADNLVDSTSFSFPLRSPTNEQGENLQPSPLILSQFLIASTDRGTPATTEAIISHWPEKSTTISKLLEGVFNITCRLIILTIEEPNFTFCYSDSLQEEEVLCQAKKCWSIMREIENI